MKVVILGGTGLIGSRVAKILRAGNQDVVAASSSMVDLISGLGLRETLSGADVVIDVTNAPSFEDSAVLNFFRTSASNVLPLEAEMGVKHHIALSIVGADLMTEIGYMRAKVVQEQAIAASGVAYTIVRATQFFEFIGTLADGATSGDSVRLSNVPMQPIAADDLAGAVASVALQSPTKGIVNVVGPERKPLDEFARELFQSKQDPRRIVTDPHAGYFGSPIPDLALVTDRADVTGTTRFSKWLLSQ